MRILGIDPGAVSGGCAIVEISDGVAPQLVDAIDLGALEATIQLLEVPMTIVEPTAWKKFHQLRGGDKEASRQRALQLFPAAHALLARRKDHGRAEAALIALAGVNHGPA